HYLGRYPELGDSDNAAPDLIQAEYEVRQQFGFMPELGEYERRFPRQADTLRPLLRQRTVAYGAAPPAARAAETTRARDTTQPTGRPTVSRPELPEQFGRFRVLRKLGEG